MSSVQSKQEPIIIDGKGTAATIRQEIAKAVKFLKEKHKATPGLATVLVGNRTDSATYVRFKKKAAAEVGFHSIDRHLDEKVTEEELLKVVKELAEDDEVHGILVQLPLPKHINEHTVLSSIPVNKDVDGFSALNIGNLVMRGGEDPKARPCTPWMKALMLKSAMQMRKYAQLFVPSHFCQIVFQNEGCIELLKRYKIEVAGKNAVVLGRSNIVGMPVAAMLQNLNATVTVCHSKTKNLKEHLLRADIIIAAIGRAEFVKADMVKPGATVIDVGINSKPDATRKRGYRLVGDVDYKAVKEIAGAITPVPGGVGPMTIAMLLKNTFNLCLSNNKISFDDALQESMFSKKPFPAS